MPPFPTQSSSPNIANVNSSPQPVSPPFQAATPDAKKAANLQAKIAVLESQISELEAKREELRLQLKTTTPHLTVRKHINLLTTYNEIRDIGMGLMGMIAESRGLRIKDVYEEFGVEPED
ncbi:hypothetical protein MMC12_002029 [Toensbergia leucococca]|nr:hypothetical protein [Toensbergia leucococca]